MTPRREPPDTEQVRLNMQAMRDKAREFTSWARAFTYGPERHALYQAAYFAQATANELDAALRAMQPEQERAA